MEGYRIVTLLLFWVAVVGMYFMDNTPSLFIDSIVAHATNSRKRMNGYKQQFLRSSVNQPFLQRRKY
jgi:hypothetical protein